MTKKRPAELDTEVDFFPPFQGFPKEGLDFLRKLKKNNSKEWFEPRKAEYERLVKFPMQCFVSSLGAELKSDLPDYAFNPKKSIFRIHRDVRFSADKSPYKTNIGASFNLANRTKEAVELPGFYVHIEPKTTKDAWGCFAGGGLYMPSSSQLKAIRAKIIDESERYESLLDAKTFKKFFGAIQGEKLKTAPKGYDIDHPMIEHLKCKQFFASRAFEESDVTAAAFVKLVAETFRAQIPLVNFLAEAVESVELSSRV